MTAPALRDYFEAANFAYNYEGLIGGTDWTSISSSFQVPGQDWKILRVDNTHLSDGFFAVAYEDNHGNIIISYAGTSLGFDTYSLATLGADFGILVNYTPQALRDATAFAYSITSQFTLSTYVAGHSLGGAEAEAAVSADSSILGGTLFAAPGLPGNNGYHAGNLTNYVDAGDFVANYANDGPDSTEATLSGFFNHYHLAPVTSVGASHHNDLANFEVSLGTNLLAAAFGVYDLSDFIDLMRSTLASVHDHLLPNYLNDLISAGLLSQQDFSNAGPTSGGLPTGVVVNDGTSGHDGVGASVSDHGTLVLGSVQKGYVEFADKSYFTGPTAGTIITTGALAGTPVDKDWYAFNTTTGATYTVTVSSTSISSGRAALSIKNSAGNTVDVNQIGNSSDDVVDSASGTSTITFTATGTQYYAAISAGGADGVWQFATGGYNISLSQSTATTVSIGDMSITEGNSGTKMLTFAVTRSGGTAPFDVNYTTADGSATVADNDYVAASGTLHFGANVNTQTIQVTINGDTKVEPDQSFSVLLSGATNGTTISRNQATGTILTDDTTSAPKVTITTTGGLTSSTTQTISGTVDLANAGATVTVYDDSTAVGSAVANSSGNWTANVMLTGPGANTLAAKATNSGGTGVSNAVFYTVATASYSLSPSSPNATENQGSLVFTLTRTNETDAQNVFVQTNDNHGSANPGNTYFNEQNLVAVSFAQYAAATTFAITINDVHATSGSQTFGVSVYPTVSISGSPLATTTFTINDTDTNTGPLAGNIISNDTVTGTTTITSQVNLFNGATLQNNGVIYINGGGSIGGDNAGGLLFNPTGHIININTADTSSQVIDITRVINDGTIIAAPGPGNVATIWTTNGSISDTGSLQVLSGTLQLHMFGASSTASLNASGISVDPSANLQFTGAGTFNISGGSYNIAGTTIVGSASYSANVVFGAGTVVNAGGNWSILNGSVDFSAATLTGTFSSLNIASAFSMNLGANNVTINNFSSFLMNIAGTGTITLSGKVVTDAIWRGNGTVINQGFLSAPVNWQDGEITSGETFINHGVVNNQLIDAGAIVTNASDGVMSFVSQEMQGAVTNNGLLHFTWSGLTAGQVNGKLTNNGTTEFSSGSGWTLNNGGTSTASNLIIDPGTRLFVAGTAAANPLTITGGAFDGTGNLWVLSGAGMKFTASTQVGISLHNDGTLEIGGGTLTLGTTSSGAGSVLMDAGTTLALVTPQSFTNSISGFAQGDIIDLIGVTASAATINGSNQLVVTDAGTTVATLQMTGSYPGAGLQFLLTPDGTGGTKITLGVPTAPVVNAGAVATFIDSQSPVAVVLDGALTLTSGGNPTLAGAAVSVSSGFQAGDVLAAATTGTGITASYNSSTGLLTLSGSDSLANYQAVLQSVTFNSVTNAQASGGAPSRTISWVATDGSHASSVASSTVTIADAAPVLSAVADPTFRVGGPPVALDNTLSIADIDNTTMAEATVSISFGFNSGDVLGVNTAGTSITVASNAGGTLHLTGADTLADYQTVLRTVAFSTTGVVQGTRIIVWGVNDGRHASTLAVTSLDIPNETPLLTLPSANVAATAGHSIAASSLFSAADANNDALTYYLFDATSAANSGYFSVDGTVVPAGAPYALTATQLTHTSFVAGAAGTSDDLFVEAFDGKVYSGWSEFHVNVAAAANHAPAVSVASANVAATAGQSLSAASLFSATDADNDALTYYLFDATSATGSGHFSVNGSVVPAGGVYGVTATQLAQTSFVAGAAGTSDDLFVEAFDGKVYSGWSEFHVNVAAAANHAPAVSVASANVAATAGQSLSAASLFSATDADNDALTYYLFDATSATGSGHFSVNGSVVPAGGVYGVTATQLAQTSFVAGAAGASDDLFVEAFDGKVYSGWSEFHVNVAAAANHAPVVSVASANVTATAGQSLSAASLFSATDADNDTLSYFLFDATSATGSGHFSVNGSVVPAGGVYGVTGTQLAQTSFVAGAAGTSDDLFVEAFDGKVYSGWSEFHVNVAAAANHAPVVSVALANVTATAGQSLSAASLFSATDADNDTLSYFLFDATSATGSGHFSVNGSVVPPGAVYGVTATQLAQTSFVAGAAGTSDDLFVEAFDGKVYSGWSEFHVLA